MSQQCCNAMLRWAKNRLCESSRVTSPLRRITFKPGKFANFKVLFSVVSTDFPSLVYIKSWKNRRGRVSSARDLWVQVPIPFFSEKRNFHAVRPHKKRNLTNLTNRALSWNGTVKWPKYISRVHVKVGAREICDCRWICHSSERRATISSLCFACLRTRWFSCVLVYFSRSSVHR